MMSYYDPIAGTNETFDANTIVYIVCLDADNYTVRAISSGLEHLTKDPTTNAAAYWLLKASEILQKSDDHSVIFPDGVLTTGTFSAAQLQTYFDLNIAHVAPQRFHLRVSSAANPNPATLFSVSRSVTPSLNIDQQLALRGLARHGLTSEMLINLRTNGRFGFFHYGALDDLIRQRNFTVHDALAEIEGLSFTQAMGVSQGLSRSDVYQLTEVSHVIAMRNLKSKGLTAEIILNYTSRRNKFDHDHLCALKYLIARKNLNITQALASIESMSDSEFDSLIRRAKAREELLRVTPLDNSGWRSSSNFDFIPSHHPLETVSMFERDEIRMLLHPGR